MRKRSAKFLMISFLGSFLLFCSCALTHRPDNQGNEGRERLSLNKGWTFYKYDSPEEADSLFYDVRPAVEDRNDNKVADSKPTEAVLAGAASSGLKAYILPSGNAFIKDTSKHLQRPEGSPAQDFPFVKAGFDDSHWARVDLPHDWGVEGAFQKGWDAEVGGGMGRLASHGVAWYRKSIRLDEKDRSKSIFLDVDGAMSYAMVWLNGQLVGGWPYGYNSWRLDLTPYIRFGQSNQLAIRIDNPAHSARWYPGGGIYRNVWLTKTSKVHVSQWGTYITARDVSMEKATLDIEVAVDNDSEEHQMVALQSFIYVMGPDGEREPDPVLSTAKAEMELQSGQTMKWNTSLEIKNPALWGPPPQQKPHLYTAVTRLYRNDRMIDEYQTRFGIRTVECHPAKGLLVNGEAIRIQGVNQHHDLGALGAAFNYRAAERQLLMLRELGCNAIRMAHNPPAPELLELTDRMGFMVVDEVFDSWQRKKTPWDFHLIFKDWYEQDTRAMVRRDRNCPSVIMWSFGNEVGEQYTGDAGAALAQQLHDIVKEEDPTRPSSASMNWAKPDMPFAAVMDIISLNYQGEGIRDAAAYSHLNGIRTSPLYPAFHNRFPEKMIVSSETGSALSTRGTYLFPVEEGISAPAEDGKGGDPNTGYVSAYELYTAQFGASADKVFASQDRHPYVAGEFVWTGWDHLGEPTPYYLSRSSYCGIIDLAGFKKDRFYLYQSRWRPELPVVHILPHWNWPGREGKITPVQVFTSGDEVELFLNGRSMGRKKKGPYEYRLRWDDIMYEAGTLKAIAYKNGAKWAEDTVETTGAPDQMMLISERDTIRADGVDLAFISVEIRDEKGRFVANASNDIAFALEGPGEIVATDNGDPTDMTAFRSKRRKAFGGRALAIIKAKEGQGGQLLLKATSPDLGSAQIIIHSEM